LRIIINTPQVYNRVRDGNFSLEGIAPGMDIHGKTVGVLGTGRIGEAFVRLSIGEKACLSMDGYTHPRTSAC